MSNEKDTSIIEWLVLPRKGIFPIYAANQDVLQVGDALIINTLSSEGNHIIGTVTRMHICDNDHKTITVDTGKHTVRYAIMNEAQFNEYIQKAPAACPC